VGTQTSAAGHPPSDGRLADAAGVSDGRLADAAGVSEVIGPPAPQIVPKKHVALACWIWQGGTQHRQRPK